MRNKHKYSFLFILLTKFLVLFSQNETSKWYFGNNAGINFSANPPIILTNGSTASTFGCAAMSNAQGNILFYTDGMNIWNQTHAIMANGTGLTGTNSAQSAVIVKQPGNANLYYVFTVQGGGGAAGLNYSIVDMNLAAGNGSVTVKNASLYASPCEEKISAVKQCDQTNFWVMVKEMSNTNFRAYQLTAAGVSTVATTTSIGPPRGGPSTKGTMKFSPNGKKMAEVYSTSNAVGGVISVGFYFYDFNTLTGVLTNSGSIGSFGCPLGNCWGYGTEFSPNSSQIYYTYHGYLLQYNACNVPTFINGGLGSEEGNSVTYNRASMQLAPNGKIYIAKVGANTLDVINNPNVQGPACGYSVNAMSISPGTGQYGLPNFVTSYFEQMPGPFTFSSNLAGGCMNVAFSSPTICAFSGYSVAAQSWNFGDPGSGAANTSALSSPTHSFSASGTYTVRLITNYICNKTDTLYKVLSVSSPSFSVLTPSFSCGAVNATLTAVGGIGPYSYTWSPSQQTTAIANNLLPGNYVVSMKDNGSGCIGNFTVVVPLVMLSSTVITTNLPCYGMGSGSASVAVVGGSGTYSYSWSNSPLNTASLTGLNVGTYSLTLLDVTNQCSVSNVFTINQPAPLSLAMVVLTPTACVGNNIILYTGANGGNAPYSYLWAGGPSSVNYTVNEQNPGLYTYSCTSIDANNCSITNTISVTFIATPNLSVSGASVCLGAIAILNASGANTYTWNPGSILSSSITVSPSATTLYTVTGSLAGCTNSATAFVVLFSQPTVNIINNSPLCSGSTLNLTSSASGAIAYSWIGPSGFVSSLQNPSLPLVGILNAGTYSLFVTAANSCTASAMSFVNINANPTVSILGTSIICVGQSMQLQAFGANTYSWSNGSNNSVILVNPQFTSTYSVTGTNTLTTCSSTNNFNIKVVDCLSIEESSGLTSNIKLFPNPTQSVLYIETEVLTRLKLISESGALLFETEVSVGLNSFDLRKYANGVYFIIAMQDHNTSTFKVVKTD